MSGTILGEALGERALIPTSKERVETALLNLEVLATAGSSESVRRAACRDLLEFEGHIGPGAAIKARKPEQKLDEKVINQFVLVLAETLTVNGELGLQGGSLEDSAGDSPDKPLLPL